MNPVSPTATKTCFIIFLFFNTHFVLAADLSINVKQRGTGSAVEGAVVVLGETEIFAETDKSAPCRRHNASRASAARCAVRANTL